ncbi:deoxyribonuclease V [Mucilaginibacter ginkgonis]|uniref:Endonuclease V n=1 Tax=Mucilaginibacter ginkgonis TaxID=2682091 RepID=A0A6I4HW96_9SPHI|nr:deoxyribonuclease V [Mucilaginibacter ginkgonis]QQL50973.1 endonuclease V [Mucilaginibacter ginkgonis]
MKLNSLNYDSLSPAQTVALQQELRKHIQIRPLYKEVKIIGSADISFNKGEETVYAGIVLFKYPELTVIGNYTAKAETKFPCISGLLAFRELPALLKVWEQIETKPDLMVLDGQGIAHERRMGIATHFGWLTDVPTIGSAKSRLAGRFIEPANEAFAQSEMTDKGEVVSIALRSKKNCNPIYISPGHHIDIEQSVEVIKNCIRGYRIPEPIRQAHNLVNEFRIKDIGSNAQQLLF